MSWVEHGGKRGSLHRAARVDEDEGMEDNSLYSGRGTVSMQDFRVCVRRTEASDRCRMKGDGVLRADMDALHLLDKSGDIVYSWPYKYLRRFGRDKSTFSFEAGRRCDSGEGSFEFDTKQGNSVFQAVEAAINAQRISLPHRQASGGGQGSPDSFQSFSLPLNTPPGQSRTPPPPQTRSHITQPPAAQVSDGVYSMLTDAPKHHKDKESSACSQQQQRPQLSRLEPPVDKVLTGVKSLTLDTRGVPIPRKNQVKTISSCPLPNPEAGPSPAPGPGSSPTPRLSPNPNQEQTYSQITVPAAADRGAKREKRSERGGGLAPPGNPTLITPEPEYSLPFDTITKNIMMNIPNSHEASASCVDPVYDSIDEMQIRNIFSNEADTLGATYRKVEHIYDEPEGCAAPKEKLPAPTSLYDDPEEMRGDAWRIMGASDPKGHEYPYNPRVDDYAVPKRPQRAFPAAQDTTEEAEEDVEEEAEQGVGQRDSPYNNVKVKM
ncbi:uncharacterized protein dok2 isoform X2 [Mastacembelus armatus]|nr:uncharacterized protein LOC113138604 isoform X2 [Mastacembelus armatus]